jgi:hypothetical protein
MGTLGLALLGHAEKCHILLVSSYEMPYGGMGSSGDAPADHRDIYGWPRSAGTEVSKLALYAY